MAEGRMRQMLWAGALSAGLILPAMAAAKPAAKLQAKTKPVAVASLPPQKAATINVAYDLRFWFIPFGHTTYRGVFKGGAYQASSYFKTSGLVSVFWKAEIDAGSSGRVGPHGLSPYIYDSYNRRSATKKQRVKLTFRDGAPPELTAKPAYNTSKYPVTVKEQEQGVDPMSAVTLILSGLSADAANPCGTVAPVFDGRRRYNIEFTYIKDQKVKLDDGMYSGTAHLCRVRYHQIAGYKQEILNGDKSKWPPIFALVADVPAAGAPHGHYVVPLKLWAKTKWGTVTAELSKLKTGEASKG
jgi:hypothetical protein